MTKEQLQSVSDWFHSSPHRIPALRAVNGVCVAGAVAAFAYGVLWRPGLHDPKLTLRLVLTCGVPFVLLSAVRHAVDLPRPFEVYDLEPLLPREKPGRVPLPVSAASVNCGTSSRPPPVSRRLRFMRSCSSAKMR